MQEMTSRERVEAALAHSDPDRVPLDVGGGQSTSLSIEAYERLKEYLGISAPTAVLNKTFRVARLDEETLIRLGSDVRPVVLRTGSGPSGPPAREQPAWDPGTLLDELGVTWHQVQFPGGFYWEQATFPLREATLDDLDRYPWPDPDDPWRYEGLADEVERLHRTTRFALMGDCGYKSLWEPAFTLLGFERALIDLVADEEFMAALLEKLFAIVSTVTRRFLEIAGPYLTVVRTADDLATQQSLMMSPATYRKVIKPFHRRYFALIRQYTDAKIFFHSDGNVVALLDDLIEIGVDVLNPVQVSAFADPELVKQRYGEQLAFWGGIDTQTTLPRGTPEEVAGEVALRIRQFGDKGGYVIAPVHNILADVPPENIVAMCEAARTGT
ncbi:MAG: uroporphyrinogen decarboxylase family protein [Acidimicrobiales bacterium]|jgi:uroporphyrinogen decarboxylase